MCKATTQLQFRQTQLLTPKNTNAKLKTDGPTGNSEFITAKDHDVNMN